MKLLLDTNVFLRWMSDSPLPRTVERILARRDTECVISIITGWEIVMKAKLGLSAADFEEGLREMGATLLPIKFKHLDEFSQLPASEIHKDPFDRMLIAQAVAEDLAILTSDTRFEEYKRLRVIWD